MLMHVIITNIIINITLLLREYNALNIMRRYVNRLCWLAQGKSRFQDVI